MPLHHHHQLLDTELSIPRNPLNLGKVPFLVTERTYTAGLEPTLDTIQVKDVSTSTKGNRQTIVVGRGWVGLVFNRWLVQTIPANGTLTEAFIGIQE